MLMLLQFCFHWLDAQFSVRGRAQLKGAGSASKKAQFSINQNVASMSSRGWVPGCVSSISELILERI